MPACPPGSHRRAGTHTNGRERGAGTVSDAITRTWRKSSYSGNENACLELLTPPPPGQAPVRDSKRTDDTVIIFPSAAWSSLVEAVRRGDLA
ncbi:DUF397 domain-containing protein [Streptomyces sp. ISL-43]|uniref:DUF397 domain-containing protein n=1 Tax=Streptomyces sp. ISL-43 TaxID=2819183 RepID=UPI001BE6CA81|nr:DUF397 domain-containing protein [Streptomyces sp. ISL-43]MBT2451795.1 DUF397 domain-containing protein [Streptomyces sp. ISL-43]